MIIGTRGSRLAMAQTDIFLSTLRARFPETQAEVRVVATMGDRARDRPLEALGGPGAFVKELDERMLAREIDCAVNSLKDMPVDPTPGTEVACVLPRGPPEDVLVAGAPLEELRQGAVIGSASVRRKALLLNARPDLDVRPLRGNITTRLTKMRSEGFDGVVLARVGLERLGIGRRRFVLDPDSFVPAVGQGAIAIVCRSGLPEQGRLMELNDARARREVEAERYLLRALGGGCSMPIGIHARTVDGDMLIRAVVLSPDGERRFDLREGCGLASLERDLERTAARLRQGSEGML